MCLRYLIVMGLIAFYAQGWATEYFIVCCFMCLEKCFCPSCGGYVTKYQGGEM